MQHLLVNLVLVRGVDREVTAILFNQRLAAEVEAMQPYFTFSPALGGGAHIRDKNSLRPYSSPPLTRITPTNRVKCDRYYVTGPWPLKSYKYIIESSFQNLQLNSQNLVMHLLDFQLQ